MSQLHTVQVTFITGATASGKTTIARALYDEFAPRRETYWFADINRYSSRARHMGAYPVAAVKDFFFVGRRPEIVIISSSDPADMDLVVSSLSQRGYPIETRIIRATSPIRA